MMKLYIEVKNGKAKNHPAIERNLIQAFGKVPDNWEPFTRVEKPIPSLYEVLAFDMPNYEKVNGVWSDVWLLRPMTEAEKTAKQQAAKDEFNAREQAENWSAWIFDEATCTMVPPIPRPEPDQSKIEQGIYTFWCGANNNWRETPPRPQDVYEFDFFAWQWVEVKE